MKKVRLNLEKLYNANYSYYLGTRQFLTGQSLAEDTSPLYFGGVIRETVAGEEVFYSAYSERVHGERILIANNFEECEIMPSKLSGVILKTSHGELHLSGREYGIAVEEIEQTKPTTGWEGLLDEIGSTETLSEVEKYGKLLCQNSDLRGGHVYAAKIYSYNGKNWFVGYKNDKNITFREYDGELPKKGVAESPAKRVVQISVDVEIDTDYNGDVLAEDIAENLEGAGYVVLGSAFQADLTRDYAHTFDGNPVSNGEVFNDEEREWI